MRILVPKNETAVLGDPSEAFRPELKFKDSQKAVRTDKDLSAFRNYEENLQTTKVKETYRKMHQNQSLAFVQEKRKKWTTFDKAEMTIMEAIFLLDDLIDESDPDTDLPNSVHAFQTAERIRAKFPDKGWFQLAGLIHDVGKVMALWGEPQWCVVGDTFPVGCKFDESCVFFDFFKDNPDWNDSRYKSPCGIYERNCGLDQITMSWGHDEYMYQVLTYNQCTLPEEALYIVRYHSFYPYHSSGAYTHLTDERDKKMLYWLNEFNGFDLYSKADTVPDIEKIKPYYRSLIDEYIPGVLKW